MEVEERHGKGMEKEMHRKTKDQEGGGSNTEIESAPTVCNTGPNFRK